MTFNLKKLSLYFLVFILIILFLFCLLVLKFRKDFHSKYKECQHIVSINFGLGNQLLEYAFGYALSKETGQKVCYSLDFSKNPKVKHEKNAMDLFDVKMDIVDFHFNKLTRSFPKFIRKYIYYIHNPIATSQQIYLKDSKIDTNTIIMNTSYGFHPEIMLGSNFFNYWTCGYFNIQYFDKYRKDLLKQFKLKVPLDSKNKKMLKEIKKYKNSVSIHIRRGDYLKLPAYNIVEYDNYYRDAMKKFESLKDVHYFIFSNDPEWVKSNFKTNRPATIVDINGDLEAHFDLELMKNCKHHIITNSTFSFMGAYLDGSEDSIVVAPKYHSLFRCKKNEKICFITIPTYPKNWVVIDNFKNKVDKIYYY